MIPVDYKKGSPQASGSPWPSDQVQVCRQALVLREHGYRCDHAELYYVSTRQRVRLEVTAERLSWPWAGWPRHRDADLRHQPDASITMPA